MKALPTEKKNRITFLVCMLLICFSCFIQRGLSCKLVAQVRIFCKHILNKSVSQSIQATLLFSFNSDGRFIRVTWRREIQDFVLQERPFWPNEPTRCPVLVCTEVYARCSNFMRHWQQKHEQVKMSYMCTFCEHKFLRQDVAKAHKLINFSVQC